MIVQKPTTSEALIKFGNNFCEAHGITKITKLIIQTIQAGLAQLVIQHPKQNNQNVGKQHKKPNLKHDNRKNPYTDMSNHTNTANVE